MRPTFRAVSLRATSLGYSLGGRLIKDKLFFFNSTEWTRVRSQGELLAFVPTPQLISLSAPATRDFFSAYTLAARTTGRIRTASQLGITGVRLTRPRFRKWLIQFRQIWVAAFPRMMPSTVTRVDWILSDKTQVYGRYALQDNLTLPGTGATVLMKASTPARRPTTKTSWPL